MYVGDASTRQRLPLSVSKEYLYVYSVLEFRFISHVQVMDLWIILVLTGFEDYRLLIICFGAHRAELVFNTGSKRRVNAVRQSHNVTVDSRSP